MDEEIEIDLRKMFNIIMKRKWIIAYTTLLSILISSVISFYFINPVYEAGVSVVVVKEEARVFYEDRYTNSDVTMYQKLLKTYAEIAKSNTVIKETANNLKEYKAEDIKKNIKVVPKLDTQILEIKIKNKNAADAADIANELAKNFVEKGSDILPAGNLNILDEAEIPQNPVSPNRKLNIAIAFFLGLMVSIGIIFMIEYMDTKVRDEEDIEKHLHIPVLGSITKN
jgi:capsular polysaccharide biosynthesis protein